ncbi:hypothetical protein Ancab_007714, partial [Ancistrocladus abbreviatus]
MGHMNASRFKDRQGKGPLSDISNVCEQRPLLRHHLGLNSSGHRHIKIGHTLSAIAFKGPNARCKAKVTSEKCMPSIDGDSTMTEGLIFITPAWSE